MKLYWDMMDVNIYSSRAKSSTGTVTKQGGSSSQSKLQQYTGSVWRRPDVVLNRDIMSYVSWVVVVMLDINTIPYTQST